MKIKTFLLCALAGILAVATACSGEKKNSSDSTSVTDAARESKSIVVYFSATGVTQKQAERLGKLIGAPVEEILPSQPYTNADLDWQNPESRSSKEKEDKNFHPGIANKIENLADYQTIYVGFPIWWYTYPNIISTFMEDNKEVLKGKTIMPFATSGGSTIEKSEQNLRAAYPDVKFGKGLLMNDVSDEEIKAWASQN